MSKVKSAVQQGVREARGNFYWDAVKLVAGWVIAGGTAMIAGFASWFKGLSLPATIFAIVVSSLCVWAIVIAVVAWVKRRADQRRIASVKVRTEASSVATVSVSQPAQHDQLTVEAVRCEDHCELVIHNPNTTVAADNVEALLVSITPIPETRFEDQVASHTRDISGFLHGKQGDARPFHPLPTRFPIALKPKHGDGRIINPNAEGHFYLFNFAVPIFFGAIPSIRSPVGVEILSPDSPYCPFAIGREWAKSGEQVFQQCRFTVRVSSRIHAAREHCFKMTVVYGEHRRPTFEIEKL
jgi:hypothetical protein